MAYLAVKECQNDKVCLCDLEPTEMFRADNLSGIFIVAKTQYNQMKLTSGTKPVFDVLTGRLGFVDINKEVTPLQGKLTYKETDVSSEKCYDLSCKITGTKDAIKAFSEAVLKLINNKESD